MRFHFTTVVWGEDYVNTFLSYSLPMQLLSENLGAFNPAGAVYHLYTRNEDFLRMKQNPVFSQLQQQISFRFHPIELGAHPVDKYALMNRCHRDALQLANGESCPLIAFGPDTIFLNGAFKTVRTLAEKGMHAILVSSLRLNLDTLDPIFKKTDLSLLSQNQWIDLALGHLHPMTLSSFWGSTKINEWISQICWQPNANSLLVRGFHLHPLLIWPEKSNVFPKISLDDSFLKEACPDSKKWHVIQTSDEMVSFELSRTHAHQFNIRSMSENDLAYWIWRFTGENHRKYVQTAYVLSNQLADPSIQLAIHESQRVVDALLEIVKKPTFQFLTFAYRQYLIELSQRVCRRLVKIFR
jgi:hypothetical protein